MMMLPTVEQLLLRDRAKQSAIADKLFKGGFDA